MGMDMEQVNATMAGVFVIDSHLSKRYVSEGAPEAKKTEVQQAGSSLQ